MIFIMQNILQFHRKVLPMHANYVNLFDEKENATMFLSLLRYILIYHKWSFFRANR